MGERTKIQIDVRTPERRCPYCHDEIGQTLARTACQNCEAWHHSDCWNGHGGCSSCGYVRPGDAQRRAVRQPVRRPQGHVCSIPGCGAPLPSAIAVPRLCLAHAEEARQRNPRGQSWNQEVAIFFGVFVLLLLTAGALVMGLVTSAWATKVARLIPAGLIFLLPLVCAAGCGAWVLSRKSRKAKREESERLALSLESPGREEPLSTNTPSPDYIGG